MKNFKVAIVGAPSSGKTRLAHKVISELKKQSVVCSYVGEAARPWMASHGRYTEVPQDQFSILMMQMKAEANALKSQDVIITDNSTWLGVVYASGLVRMGTDREKSDWLHVCQLIEDTLMADYALQYYVPRGIFKTQLEPGRVQTEEAEFDEIDKKIRGMIDLFNLPVIQLGSDYKNWAENIVNDIKRKLEEE